MTRYLRFYALGFVHHASAIALAVTAVVFLSMHAGQMPRSLEDVDSINLAMGVERFDLTEHRPHPPGYPLFIELGRLSTAALRRAGLEAPEARGLAVWGVLAGTLAVIPLFFVFRRLTGRPEIAAATAIVSVTAPLFWFNASRPLTDVTGLTAALAAQAIALSAWYAQRDLRVSNKETRARLLAAMFSAGLVIGLRSQTFLLTLPLCLWLLADLRVAAPRRPVTVALAALGVGIACWAVPLFIWSGGVAPYLRALVEQGQQDFRGVTMLWTHPSLHQLTLALRDSLIRPWAYSPMGASVVAAAALGAVVLIRQSRTTVLLLATLTVPYALFHLLFHETATVRYALPLIPPMVFLAAIGVDATATIVSRLTSVAQRVVSGLVAATAVAASLSMAVPALRAYSATPSPLTRALANISERAEAETERGRVLVTHFAAQRATRWANVAPNLKVLPLQPSYEWLAAVRYWLSGGEKPVWFLARRIRTDLALFDPRDVKLVEHYTWPFETATFLGGIRPNGIDWYEIERPGWFLDKGWALTPETGGVAAAHGDGPATSGSLAYIARTNADVTIMLGGRQLGAPGTLAKIRGTIDGRTVVEWTQAPGSFLRLQKLPAGALLGADGFARLLVTTEPAQGPAAPVLLDQFDAAPSSSPMWGFGDGFMEPEFDPGTRRLWRWSSGLSTLRVPPRGRPITVKVVGQTPKRASGQPPQVTVRVGPVVIDTFQSSGDFERELVIPDDALRASDGHVTFESTATFVPDATLGNGDRRELAFKVFRVAIR
ncbi:MAG: DUF2723 domain-containing protein [Acidobacteria bacterium]|nr:DUF2723 domain-containing protein [Acidobacteriota bacterium]